jgi:hypothetical protein
MFEKVNYKKISTLLAGAAVFGVVHSQTIEEITDLNKQKVVAELRKQVDAAKADSSRDLLNSSRSQIPATKEVSKDRLPDIVAIYGQRPDALIAILNDGGTRNVRMRAGDFTSSGWEIEKISPSTITLRKETPSNKKKKIKKDASPDVDQRTFKRMSVSWNNSTPTPVMVTGGAAQLPPVPTQSSPVMGYGATQPPALTVQLPQAASGVR